MIKGILFDFGELIAFNNLDKQLEVFAKELKIDAEELKQVEKGSHDKMILGKLSVKEFLTNVRNKFSLEKDSTTLLLVWERIYGEITKLNIGLLNAVKELKKKYKVGLISNIFDSTAQFHQRQKLFYFFKPVMLSCRTGIAKPDIRIYARAIKEMELKGNEVLYVDNNEKYLESAREFGMKTILFENNEQFFKELKKLKIKYK